MPVHVCRRCFAMCRPPPLGPDLRSTFTMVHPTQYHVPPVRGHDPHVRGQCRPARVHCRSVIGHGLPVRGQCLWASTNVCGPWPRAGCHGPRTGTPWSIPVCSGQWSAGIGQWPPCLVTRPRDRGVRGHGPAPRDHDRLARSDMQWPHVGGSRPWTACLDHCPACRCHGPTRSGHGPRTLVAHTTPWSRMGRPCPCVDRP